jgi:hypothetical protein
MATFFSKNLTVLRHGAHKKNKKAQKSERSMRYAVCCGRGAATAQRDRA